MDIDTQNIQTDISPPAIIRNIKYDPAKKVLRDFTEGMTYLKGDTYICESSSLIDAFVDATTLSHQKDIINVDVIASKYETAISKYKKTWESVPTIESYFELDAINNVEEVEIAFYRASEEHGW